jgi:hypothetical protein
MKHTEVSKNALTIIVNQLSNVPNADRALLDCVNVRKDTERNQWAIESTNGHYLCVNYVDLGEIKTSFKAIRFFTAYLSTHKAQLKQAKGMSDADNIDVSLYVEEQSDDYPVLQSVTPVRRDDDIVIGFNAEYLFEMLKSMRTHKAQAIVRIAIKASHRPLDNAKPILVDILGEPDAGGVLMPCRVERPAVKAEPEATTEPATVHAIG